MREEAEYLRLALMMELVTVDDVVSWADRQIEVQGEATPPLIDLSLAGSAPADEVAILLEAIPGNGDLIAAAHRALRQFSERFRSGAISLDKTAVFLWAYSQCSSAPDDERARAANFCDAIPLTQRGIGGTPESARAEIESFLAAAEAGH